MSSQQPRAQPGAPAAANGAPSQPRRQQQQQQRGARPPRSKTAPSAGGSSKARSDQAPSIAPTASTSAPKKRKKKEGGPAQDHAAADKARLKVVVRKLPPNLPEAILWKAVAPWVSDGKPREGEEQSGATSAPRTADWLSFVPGKIKTRDAASGGSSAAHHRHSRAYIRFINAQHLADFHRNFDGHVFRDAKGSEHVAVVEFAPYQKVPADSGRRKKRDPRQGTLDEDADYQSFLESLKAEPAASGEQSLAEKTEAQLLAHLAASDGAALAERAKNTPLLEHLRQQRALLGRRKAEAKLSKVKSKGKEKVSKRKGALDAKPPSGKKRERARKFKEKEKEKEVASAVAAPKPEKSSETIGKKPPKAPRSKTKPTRATEPTPQPTVAPQMILKRQAPPANAPSGPGSSAPARSPPTGPAASTRPPPSGPSIPTGPAAGNRGRNRARGRGGGGGGGAGGGGGRGGAPA